MSRQTPLEITGQAGATPYTAHTTLIFLQAHKVNALPSPSKSPDLNLF